MKTEQQFLCSHLITLVRNGRRSIANLERIWAEGATVNAEEPFEPGEQLQLPDLGTTAHVVFAEVDDAGHFIDLEFSPSYRWSVEKFRPQHLTDPALL